MSKERTAALGFDVAIIGAGVIGLSCALHLLRAGRSVVVLERDRVGSGASHGNCGTITPSHALPLAQPGMLAKALRWMMSKDAPFYVAPRFDPALLAWLLRFGRNCHWDQVRRATRDRAALLNLSRQLMEQLILEESIDCEFSASGLLTVFRDPRAFDEARIIESLLAEVDIPIVALDGAEVEAREPALRPGVAAGHWYPSDAVLRPDRFVAELARVVRALGGEIREHSLVDSFVAHSSGAPHAVVAGRPIAADELLLCGGAWTPEISKALGLRVPIQPGKGYSITYAALDAPPRTPLVLRERSVCVTAWESGFRLGSTMEFSGYDTRLNRLRLDALVRGASEYLLPPLGGAVQEEWYGWRPMMADDLPILGASSRLPHTWFAGGHGMLGMSMSVASGHCLAELMLGRTPAIPTAPFAPSRLGL